MNEGQSPGCPNFILRHALPILEREVLLVGFFVCFVSAVGFVFL